MEVFGVMVHDQILLKPFHYSAWDRPYNNVIRCFPKRGPLSDFEQEQIYRLEPHETDIDISFTKPRPVIWHRKKSVVEKIKKEVV